MFFSDAHERDFVQPIARRVINRDISYALDELKADNYLDFCDTVRPHLEAIKRSGNAAQIVNRYRKTNIRLWETLSGDQRNADFLEDCSDQRAASSKGDTDTDSSTGNSATNLESTNVNSSKATQTISYIYGRDVSTLNTQELLNAAVRVKAEIKALADTGVTSTKVDAMTAELNASLATIVTALDAS